MVLRLQDYDFNYDRDLLPYLRNGVIIDTSVFLSIIYGIVESRISKRTSRELDDILSFLDLIKLKNQWTKFFITPHVFTETCTNIRNKYSKWDNYEAIVKEIMPILSNMGDKIVNKEDILSRIDLRNPLIEVGDISIFVAADDFEKKNEKISILSTDYGLSSRYMDNNKVMLLDYKSTLINLS